MTQIVGGPPNPVWVRGIDGTIPVSIGSTIPVGVPSLDVPAGLIEGQAPVNKFGRSTNVDDGIDTDIWDRANATDDQDIWLAPTAPRIHTIASSSANDTTGGTGVDTVIVYTLPDWDTPETSEVITGNLNAGIAMSNAAVIIHRMKVVPQATSTNVNVGVITALAAGDATVTAQINAGEGQTQMAIYGIPSTQDVYMTEFYGSVLRANLATQETHIDFRLLFNPAPNISTTSFLVKHSLGLGSRAANPHIHTYNPYNKFSGPGILKLQAAASANNTDVSAGFDLYLLDN